MLSGLGTRNLGLCLDGLIAWDDYLLRLALEERASFPDLGDSWLLFNVQACILK